MKLRAAIISDAMQIAEIWNDIIENTLWTFTSDTKTVQDIEKLIESREQNGQLMQVVEFNDAVAGFCTYQQFRNGPGYAHTIEHTIILSVAARGLGFGKGLMDALQAHATSAGHKSIIGGISSANQNALDFHRAMGFQLAATISKAGYKNGKWLDLYFVQKML